MAVRSIWKGTISVMGVLSAPVKLYTATSEDKVPLHLVHRDCKSRIQMPRWCMTCNRKLEAGANETMQAYDPGDGTVIPLEEADLEKLPLKSARTIELVAMVPVVNIDQRAFGKSYFLGPDQEWRKGKAVSAGDKPFTILVEAMKGLPGRVAIGKLCRRDREHLVVVMPHGSLLLVQELFYASELKDANEFPNSTAEVTEREVSLGKMLLEQLSEEFRHQDHRDGYTDALKAMLEAKMGGAVVSVGPTETPSQDNDPLAKLEAFLKERKS